MTDNLKPCPFCGRAVKIIQVDPCGFNATYYGDEYACVIVHKERWEGGCIIDDSPPSSNQREESKMVELWNRRVRE